MKQFLFFLFVCFGLVAQKDSLVKKPVLVDSVALKIKKENKSRILKYFIPGYGQIQNKQWGWLGITYGGFAAGATNYIYQRNLCLIFKEERKKVFGTNGTTFVEFYNRDLTDAQLKQVTDFRRRNAEISAIGLVFGVVLQAVQANVGYHLKTFDRSDDISIKIKPHSNGLSLAVAFK